eukprot:2656062-Rhodomonas_salina.1
MRRGAVWAVRLRLGWRGRKSEREGRVEGKGAGRPEAEASESWSRSSPSTTHPISAPTAALWTTPQSQDTVTDVRRKRYGVSSFRMDWLDSLQIGMMFVLCSST